MKFIKRLGLVFSAIAFCLSLAVISADAQQGRGNWRNNNRGNAKGWYKGQRNGADNGRKRGWRNNRQVILTQQDYWNRQSRNGRITQQESWRLQRQRNRLYNTSNRYYRNDGFISNKERRKLQKRYIKYRRNVYRDRRD